MSESTNTEARERLEALVGEWAMEAGPPGGPPWPGEGRVTFEWFGGAPLLVERLHVEVTIDHDLIAEVRALSPMREQSRQARIHDLEFGLSVSAVANMAVPANAIPRS